MHRVPRVFKLTDLGSKSEVEEEKLTPIAHSKENPFLTHTATHTQVLKHSESTTTGKRR